MLTYTEKELELAVKDSFSYSEVLRKLNLSITGTSHKGIKNKIKKLCIDVSHFCRKRCFDFNRKKFSDILINNQSLKNRIHGGILRKYLIESGVEYKCVKCFNTGEWMGSPIILEVDHLDGDWKNNDPSNLRFMCPNCHAQTPSFIKKKTCKYCECGNIIKTKKANKCKKCCVFYRKSNKPSKEELQNIIWIIPSTEIAKQYNVSDRMIGKWCSAYNITKPPRGYWTKKKII